MLTSSPTNKLTPRSALPQATQHQQPLLPYTVLYSDPCTSPLPQIPEHPQKAQHQLVISQPIVTHPVITNNERTYKRYTRASRRTHSTATQSIVTNTERKYQRYTPAQSSNPLRRN